MCKEVTLQWRFEGRAEWTWREEWGTFQTEGTACAEALPGIALWKGAARVPRKASSL